MRGAKWTSIPVALCGALLFCLRPAAAQTVVDPALVIEPYATGFTSPGFFRFLPTAPAAPAEFLIGEIGTGRVLHYRGGVQLGVAADLNVAYLFERGLFGMALDPDFQSAPWVYLYYTASNTGTDTNTADGAASNRVVRMPWNGATLGTEQVLATFPVGQNHNGGALVFGQDGMLYGGIGEAGITQSQLQNIAAGAAPNNTSMVFRLAPDGTTPADNPFVSQGAGIERAYAYGMRNVFGLDVDPVSGAVWATDNGAALYDEVVRVVPGMNGGWRRVMGPAGRTPGAISNLWNAPGSAYKDPEFSFRESFGITAIHFQRGPALGEHYEGDVFVAAHNSAEIYHFDLTPDRLGIAAVAAALLDSVADDATERDLVRWAGGVGVVTDLDTGPDGALYVLKFSGSAVLYRVRRADTAGTPAHAAAFPFRAWPNPSTTTVTLASTAGGRLPDVALYDAAGRRVRVLQGTASSRTWDGTDLAGRLLPPGVYWARAAGGSPAVRIVRVAMAR